MPFFLETNMMGPDQGFVDLPTSVAQIPRSDSTPQREPWSGGKRPWVQGWDTERTQSRTRARDPSVEGNEDSGIIQSGSQKSWLISTVHVLQTFDTFRSKLANIKRYSVGICLLIK